jgi:hypothetical protein
MIRAGNLITKQCRVILESKQQAIVWAIFFSMIPLASWISVALVSLVTLRKGGRLGLDILLPALVIHSVPLMMLIPISSALINTLVTYLPCYFAALSLRKTEKWQVVFGVFAIQAFLGCLLIQFFDSDAIANQLNSLKMVLTQYGGMVDASFFNSINPLTLAQIFFGVQLLAVVISGLISLMVARSIQAKLFLPGGFKNELTAFRGSRLSFLAFSGVSLMSYYEIPIAINMLPIMLCYFFFSGFGLIYFICFRKQQTRGFILLTLLILLKPALIFSVYIIMGLLDSLFNFRSYLPKGVRESI